MIPAHVERRHLAAAVAGCAALVAVTSVDESALARLPACPLRAVTGLDCPLCGATRATRALFRGDVVAAVDLNALYVLALPVLVALAVSWLVRGRLPAAAQGRWVAPAVLAVTAVFAVVRNLPFLPFSLLGT